MEKGKVLVTVIDDFTVEFEFKETPNLERMIGRKYEPAFYRSKLLFFDNFADGSYVTRKDMQNRAVLRHNSKQINYVINAYKELDGRCFTALVDERGYLAIDPYETEEAYS